MPSSPQRPRLGFIGLGTMGSRMCQRLLAAGYPVTVWNRTQARAEPLLQGGATWAASPGDLSRRVDIVLMSLANDEAVHEIVLGPNGVRSGAGAGTTLVDLSTVTPGTSREIADAMESRGRRRAGRALRPRRTRGSAATSRGSCGRARRPRRPCLRAAL